MVNTTGKKIGGFKKGTPNRKAKENTNAIMFSILAQRVAA